MTVTLPLQPREEAKLLAIAKAKGVSPNALVCEAINRIIEEASEEASVKKEPTISARGILAKYGAAPSAEEIDKNRTEMFASFPRDDF